MRIPCCHLQHCHHFSSEETYLLYKVHTACVAVSCSAQIFDSLAASQHLKDAFIVHCSCVAVISCSGLKVRSYSTATQLQYRCIDYLSTTAQRNALHLKFTSLQYRNAEVGAETEIRPLQLTATQLQWTMNAS